MPDTQLTVSMHPTLVDELDEGFSPMDGLVAIDEIFNELPMLHRAFASRRLRKWAGRKLKVYQGCYHWYDSVGFSYVQIGTTLHVLELWYDKSNNVADMDVILGTGQTEGYKLFGSEPSGEGQHGGGNDGDTVPFTKPCPIVIEVRGGIVQDVRNVPPGYEYEVRDYDSLEEHPPASTSARTAFDSPADAVLESPKQGRL
jgi:hypothetical protein